MNHFLLYFYQYCQVYKPDQCLAFLQPRGLKWVHFYGSNFLSLLALHPHIFLCPIILLNLACTRIILVVKKPVDHMLAFLTIYWLFWSHVARGKYKAAIPSEVTSGCSLLLPHFQDQSDQNMLIILINLAKKLWSYAGFGRADLDGMWQVSINQPRNPIIPPSPIPSPLPPSLPLKY